MKLTVTGLGDGTPGSSPLSSVQEFPGQVLAGAKKWMAPSEVLQEFKDIAGGQIPGVGVILGTVLVPLLVLGLLSGGRRRRFF